MNLSHLKISTDELRMILETGFVLREAARFEEAEAVFRSMIEFLPDSEVPHIGLASVFLQRGDFLKAKDICEKAVNAFPASLYARLNHAEAMLFAGQKDEAETVLREIIETDPESPHSKTAQSLLEVSLLLETN